MSGYTLEGLSGFIAEQVQDIQRHGRTHGGYVEHYRGDIESGVISENRAKFICNCDASGLMGLLCEYRDIRGSSIPVREIDEQVSKFFGEEFDEKAHYGLWKFILSI